jgi:hypothetical protein
MLGVEEEAAICCEECRQLAGEAAAFQPLADLSQAHGMRLPWGLPEQQPGYLALGSLLLAAARPESMQGSILNIAA